MSTIVEIDISSEAVIHGKKVVFIDNKLSEATIEDLKGWFLGKVLKHNSVEYKIVGIEYQAKGSPPYNKIGLMIEPYKNKQDE